MKNIIGNMKRVLYSVAKISCGEGKDPNCMIRAEKLKQINFNELSAATVS